MSTINSLLKDKGEELEKTLEKLAELDVSLGNLNKIWKERVKQKDCGKEEYLAVERIIEKFIERKKDFGEAYHKLGNIYYNRKFYEDAKRNYKKALKIEEWEEKGKGEDKAWCYHDLGYLLYGARKYEDAIDNYEKAIDIAPKNWFYNDLGTALMKLGRYEDADNAFMKALGLQYLFSINKGLEDDLNEDSISYGLKSEFKNNGFSLSNTPKKVKENEWEIDSNEKKFIVKKESGKLNVYDKQKKDKDKAYVYNALGRLYYRKKLYEEARKKLEQAKEHNPDLDKVDNNLGLLDLEAGSYENAKLCFQKAIEMDKSEKKFFFCLAEKDAKIFLFDLKQIEFPNDGLIPVKSKLREEFVYKCGPLLSYNAELFTNKKCRKIVDGEKIYYIEEIDKSLKVYKDLLKDGPIEPELNYILEEKGLPLPADSTVNKENGKWVITDKEKKEIYCIVRKEDGKLKIYAKKKCENHAEAHLNLGNVFSMEGKIKDAGKEYGEAIRIDRNSAKAYYNLGNLAAKNEEKEKAEKLYREALRINRDYTKARTALEALDLPKETGVDWWDWWFSGSGQQSGSKKGEKIHWWKRLSCSICGQEPRQEIPRQKIPWRKLVGGALIFILFLFVIGLPIAFIAGTFIPPSTVTYGNDTVYQKISIENMFDIDAKFEKDLNNSINSNISANLTKIFKTKGFSISENATVREENDHGWWITDGKKIYVVKKEDGWLNVYKGSIIKKISNSTQTFRNTITPRTIPSVYIGTLIGLAVFIFIILIFPQLKKGSVSIGEFKFEVETKDAGTSDIAK